MKKFLFLAPAILIGLSTVATAQSMMSLPAFASTYSYPTNTRGFWFDAPAGFMITSLQVPDEAKHGKQMIAVYNMGPGPHTSSALPTAANLKFYSVGTSSATPQACSILINKGDRVGILGACGDATVTNNSYGGSGHISSILGNPVTLTRFTHQFNLVTSKGLNTIGYATSGSIGRVNVWITPQKGLYAGFDADKTIGSSPLAVQFTDKTFTSDPGGVKTWAWDLNGDTKIDSTLQNPKFIYPSVAKTATYDVSLTVTDASNPSSSITKKAFITVDPAPKADFSATPRSGAVRPGLPPMMVQFTDLSVGANTWAWDLDGDTKVDATIQNPKFVYTTGGSYDITLTVTGVGGNDKITKVNYIIAKDYQSLSTMFTGGNGGSSLWSNLFDIDVKAPAGLWITSLDVNCSTYNVPVTLDVYTAATSYVGKELTAAAWTKVSSGTGTTAAAANLPTHVDVSDIFLPFGKHAIAIHYIGSGMSYTNGNTTNQTFTNKDLTLNLGCATTALFGGSIFTPRVWNGTVNYITHGWASSGTFGAGCKGSNGIPALAAAPKSIAVLGSNFQVNLTNMPTAGGSVLVLVGFDKTKLLGAIPLPFDLTPMGAPGCNILSDIAMNFGAANVAGSGSFTIAIPKIPELVGGYLVSQAVVLDIAANTMGLTVTNGGEIHIGQ